MFKRLAFMLCCFVFFFAGCMSDRQTGTNDTISNAPFAGAKAVNAVLTPGHGASGSVENTVRVWENDDDAGINPEDLHIWIQDASLDEHKAPWYDIMSYPFGVITQEMDASVQQRIKIEWVNKSYKNNTVKLLFLDKNGAQKSELVLSEKPQTVRLGDENKFLPSEGKCDVAIPSLSWRRATRLIAIPNPKLKELAPGKVLDTMQYPPRVSPKNQGTRSGLAQMDLVLPMPGSDESRETPHMKDKQMGLTIPAPVKVSLMWDENDAVTVCLGVDSKELRDQFGNIDPLGAYKKRMASIEKMNPRDQQQAAEKIGKAGAKQPEQSPFQVTASLLGYLTLKTDPDTQKTTITESKVLLSVGVYGEFTARFVVLVVPAYVSVNGGITLTIGFSPEKQNWAENYSLSLAGMVGVEAGLGIPRVLSGGICTSITLTFSEEKLEGKPTKERSTFYVDISAKATVLIFFSWTYKLWDYESVFHKAGMPAAESLPDNSSPEFTLPGDSSGNYRNDANFTLSDESYQASGSTLFIQDQLPQAGVRNEQTVLKNVPFGTEPKIYQVGSEEVMIWIGDAPQNANRPKFNDFTLQYAVRKVGSNGPFENKGVIHDIKIDGQYTNDGDFTAIEFKGYLYLAWVKQTKPVTNGTKLEDTNSNTAIYTMWYKPKGFTAGKWDGVERVSKDLGYLQYMPKFNIQKTGGFSYDYLYLSWVVKKNNDYFARVQAGTQCAINTTWRNKHSSEWGFPEQIRDSMDGIMNISTFATGFEPSFVESQTRSKPFRDGHIAMIIENVDKENKKIWYFVRGFEWVQGHMGLGGYVLNYYPVFSFAVKNASNIQVGLIDDKQIAFWHENGEVKYCNIAEVINTQKTESIKTITGGLFPINENYQLIRDSENNVKGLVWDNSTMAGGKKSVSQGYALPWLEKEKTWGKAVPITYRNDNSIVTAPNGFIRDNGEWVISYRKLVQNDNAVMTPQNFLQSRVDGCVANMKTEPVLNTAGMFELPGQLQHVGNKMAFSAFVNNYGLTPVDQVTVTLKTKDGKKLGDFTSKQKLLPGETAYLGAQIDSLSGKDGVVPRTEIIASASYKGKNSEFAENSVPYVIGVPNLLVHNIYIQMKNGKPVANMYLSSLNGVNVPAGNAELVISETEIKSLPNGEKTESEPVVRVKPVTVRLTDVPQKFEEVCNLPNINDYDTVVTKRYSFTLRLKGEKAAEAGGEYLPSTVGVTVASPYYSRPAAEAAVYQADYDVQTKRVTALVGVTNNMAEKFSDTVCIDLMNGYTKEMVQSVRLDVTIPANYTRQLYVEFEPLEGKTGANEYAVRAHGDGGKFFGSISQWQDFIKLASSTRPAGSPSAELTEELSSLLPASRPEDALLYKVVEEHYGIALRKETRDYLNEPGRTLQDLYEALLAEKAPQLGVTVK